MFDSKTRLDRQQREDLINRLCEQRMNADKPAKPPNLTMRLLGTTAAALALGALVGHGYGDAVSGMYVIGLPAFCLLGAVVEDSGAKASPGSYRSAVIKDYGLAEPRESFRSRVGKLLGRLGEALVDRAERDVRAGVWGQSPKGNLEYRCEVSGSKVRFDPVLDRVPPPLPPGAALRARVGEDGSLSLAHYAGAKLQSSPTGYPSILRTDPAGVPMTMAWHDAGRPVDTWSACWETPLRGHPVAEPAVRSMGR